MTDSAQERRQNAEIPDGLDREGLLALLGDLRQTVAEQRRTIDEQRATIAHLRHQDAQGGATTTSGRSAGRDDRSLAAENGRRMSIRPVPGNNFTLVFDGGSLGNPGKGYGSFQIVDAAGTVVAEERMEFGDRVTNNAAEFRALIGGLSRLLDILAGKSAGSSLAVRGDSQLVIYGVSGAWRIKHAALQPLRDEAVQLLSRFGQTDVAWHPRGQSVRSLGH